MSPAAAALSSAVHRAGLIVSVVTISWSPSNAVIAPVSTVLALPCCQSSCSEAGYPRFQVKVPAGGSEAAAICACRLSPGGGSEDARVSLPRPGPGDGGRERRHRRVGGQRLVVRDGDPGGPVRGCGAPLRADRDQSQRD